MNKNRHHLGISLIILFLVSVLLSSCGTPTYCTLSNIKIYKTNTSKQDSVFSVQGTDTDLAKVTKGPGIVLLYTIVSADIEPSITDSLVNSYISPAYQTKVNYGLNIDNNNFVFNYTNTTFNLDFYAFEINSAKAKAPTFHYDLNSNKATSINKTVNLIATDLKKSKPTFTIDSASYTAKASTADNLRIILFASIYNGAGNFSNVYFSDLVEIGRYSLTN